MGQPESRACIDFANARSIGPVNSDTAPASSGKRTVTRFRVQIGMGHDVGASQHPLTPCKGQLKFCGVIPLLGHNLHLIRDRSYSACRDVKLQVRPARPLSQDNLPKGVDW